ncbi:MAG: hypothetical protein M1376_01385 [Planctomycetes bacterium]|nr:hypothetical protein [Planctomycetota bacterium]
MNTVFGCFQRRHAFRFESRLVNAAQVEVGPQLETTRVFQIGLRTRLERFRRCCAAQEDDRLLEVHGVHDFDRVRDPLRPAGAVVMHFNDRVLGLLDAGHRDLKDGPRAIVLQQQRIRRDILL